eukprot:8814202-Alexandrium_andersonii.AAC.1
MGRKTRDACNQPPVMDLATDKFSPVTRSLQHLATLLQCQSAYIELVFVFAGFGSLREFTESDHESKHLLRCSILTTSAWV